MSERTVEEINEALVECHARYARQMETKAYEILAAYKKLWVQVYGPQELTRERVFWLMAKEAQAR